MSEIYSFRKYLRHSSGVGTQTKVPKGQNIGSAEAIQTRVVCFQRYRWLSLSVDK